MPHVDQDPGMVGLLRKHLNLDILLVFAMLILGAAFFVQYQLKNFVVTADEGKAISGRVERVEQSVLSFNASLKEVQKDNEARLKEVRTELKEEIQTSQTIILQRVTEVTQRMIDRQDKYYEDLRDRIDGTPVRRKVRVRDGQ